MTAALPPTLLRFFDEMTAFLRAEKDEAALLSALGPSASKPARFLVYQRMARQNRHRVIDAVFRGTRHAASSLVPGVWERLVETHLEKRPHMGWDLALVPVGFSATVAESRATSSAIPVVLEELADLEEIRHAHRTFPSAPAGPGGLNPSVEVRRYTWNVDAYARRVRAGEAATLEPEEQVLILYRDPVSAKSRTLTPTLPMLIAVAIASGEADESVLADAGVEKSALEAAREALFARSVLGAGS
jgi:hypothetical protein